MSHLQILRLLSIFLLQLHFPAMDKVLLQEIEVMLRLFIVKKRGKWRNTNEAEARTRRVESHIRNKKEKQKLVHRHRESTWQTSAPPSSDPIHRLDRISPTPHHTFIFISLHFSSASWRMNATICLICRD